MPQFAPEDGLGVLGQRVQALVEHQFAVLVGARPACVRSFSTKRKLQLKDAIAKLESAMIPDLDA